MARGGTQWLSNLQQHWVRGADAEGTRDACRCDIGIKVGGIGPRQVGRGQQLAIHGLIGPGRQGVPEGQELEEELPGIEMTLTWIEAPLAGRGVAGRAVTEGGVAVGWGQLGRG